MTSPSDAARELLERYDCGPDGLITYVWDKKVRSANPGYCFKCAGWKVTGRSAERQENAVAEGCRAAHDR